MDAATISLIVVGVTSAIGFATFWMTLSGRISDATAKAEAAGKQASAATARVISLEKELTDLRVEVARDYVSKGTLDGMEKRVVEAINRLGERVDHAFANKSQ